MKIVVAGATGNVGTSLLDLLSQDAEVTEIVALARRSPQAGWPRTTFVAADLARDDLRPIVQGADAVVNLAWLFQPARRPLVTWSANVIGAIRLLDAVTAEKVPVFVQASSVGAYSPGPGREVDESWPTDGLPTAGYGREKAYLERVLDSAEARHPGLRVVRLRPGFIFKESSGTQQRRLFAGPFVPTPLLRPGLLPVLPYPAGLHFQAVHTTDAARAYQLALKRPVRGAFNIASEPVIDGAALAGMLGARPLAVPVPVVKAALTGAWWAHVVPAEPALLDLAMDRPVMKTDRARQELGWEPTVSATEAVRLALAGMRAGAGGGTEPLAPDSPASRGHEILTGAGRRP